MALNFKFWSRGKSGDTTTAPKKTSGPRELPQPVGQFLVVKKKEDPDWVWGLKCVVRRREDNRDVSDIRIFSPDQTHDLGIRILNYDSLEGHPELVIYQGWFDKGTSEVNLEPQ
ncbi:MAG: hypothetical protein LJE65_06080 [Desulfobacteraceae bacterium]|nr:hypothetical protein [Desulfobacteraceae bacterium]